MITYDELKKIAALAKLSLDNVDTDELAEDMASIMEVANSIDDLDLSSLDCSGDADPAELRADVCAPSLPVDAILSNAGEKRDGYFAGLTGGRRR